MKKCPVCPTTMSEGSPKFCPEHNKLNSLPQTKREWNLVINGALIGGAIINILWMILN